MEIVNLLLEKNSHTSAKDILGNTPIHLASQSGLLDIVKRCEYVNIKNYMNETPLHKGIIVFG